MKIIFQKKLNPVCIPCNKFRTSENYRKLISSKIKNVGSSTNISYWRMCAQTIVQSPSLTRRNGFRFSTITVYYSTIYIIYLINKQPGRVNFTIVTCTGFRPLLSILSLCTSESVRVFLFLFGFFVFLCFNQVLKKRTLY